MTESQPNALVRIPIAGFLAWLLPGLGHIYLGHRARGLICLITITITFWTGVAIGGVRSTVDPKERRLWFIAQLCTAGNTMAAYALNQSISTKLAEAEDAPPVAHWSSADVGVHYTGVAGLLNLLVIFDAIARADSSHPARRNGREPRGGVP